MGKKKIAHGPLYEHAKRELELAGITSGKGNVDQTLSGTVLKLIDVYERGSKSEFLASTSLNLFRVLATGELINEPTDDPDEWQLVNGLGEGVCVNRRCNAFFSRDGGVTWFRTDTGAQGVSKKVEEVQDGDETKEDVQPAES